MNLNFCLKFLVASAAMFFTVHVYGQATNGMSRDEAAGNFLQIQEQLHATQLAIQQNQANASDAVKSNTDLLAARVQSLEATVAAQRSSDVETARKTQQLTLLMVGIFGLAGLVILLLMVYFQSRAVAQFVQVSAQQNALIASSQSIHQLAAPGRATVETSNLQLLDAVGQLKARIKELENGQLKALPDQNKK